MTFKRNSQNPRSSQNSRYLLTGWLTTSVAVLVSLFLVGCQSSAPIRAVNSSAAEGLTDAQPIGGGVEAKQIKGQYVNDLYRAKVVLINTKSKSQNLQYQFTWYDRQGDEVGIDGNGWTPVVIYGKGERSLVGMAPTTEANQFRVSIRDLKATKVFKTNFLGIY